MRQPDTIVFFDFDGVIVDSLEHSLAISRKVEPTLTAKGFIERFNGNIVHHPAIKKWGPKFTEHYGLGIPDQPLFPGMKQIIEQLASKHTLVIVSAALTAPIKRFLDRHQLTGHFADVLGNDVHASKHVKISQTLEQHDISPQQAVMITDTLGDMREAAQAGIATIGVLWGFHNRATLKQGNPAALVKSPAELDEKISTLLATKTNYQPKL
jgi:phosphoglycolate phosphatase